MIAREQAKAATLTGEHEIKMNARDTQRLRILTDAGEPDPTRAFSFGISSCIA